MDGSKHKLTADEICKIIEKCAVHKVGKLYIGNLRLEFASQDDETPERVPNSKPSVESKVNSPVNHEKINKETLQLEEARVKTERVLNALIENPMLAEELIVTGRAEELIEDDEDDNEF